MASGHRPINVHQHPHPHSRRQLLYASRCCHDDDRSRSFPPVCFWFFSLRLVFCHPYLFYVRLLWLALKSTSYCTIVSYCNCTTTTTTTTTILHFFFSSCVAITYCISFMNFSFRSSLWHTIYILPSKGSSNQVVFLFFFALPEK